MDLCSISFKVKLFKSRVVFNSYEPVNFNFFMIHVWYNQPKELRKVEGDMYSLHYKEITCKIIDKKAKL